MTIEKANYDSVLVQYNLLKEGSTNQSIQVAEANVEQLQASRMIENGSARKLPPKIVFSSIVGSMFMFIAKRNFDSEYENILQDENIEKEIDLLIDIIFNGIGAKCRNDDNEGRQ